MLARLLDCCVQTGDRDMEIQGRLQLVYYGIQTGNSQVMEEHLSIIEGLLRGRERSPEYGVCLRLSGLLELIRTLPRHYGAALYLFYYEGYQAAEIGKILGVPAATVHTRLARGRARLKDILGGTDYERTV